MPEDFQQTSTKHEKQNVIQQEQNFSFTEPMVQMEGTLAEVVNRIAQEGDLDSIEKMLKMLTHKEFLLWALSDEFATDPNNPLAQAVANMESALARVANSFVRVGDVASLERVLKMLTHKEYILWSLMDES